MRLGISNLAFKAIPSASELAQLADFGFEGLEVAPTRIAPWNELTDGRLASYRNVLASSSFCVSSLQAIFFGVEGVALLGDFHAFSRMQEHMRRVAHIASQLGAQVVVFGAPRNRDKGNLTDEEAFEIGAERLSRLGDIVAEHDVTIGLEPVPQSYGGNFLTSWQSVRKIVELVSGSGLRVHLDTGCVKLGGGDIAEAVEHCRDALRHFHIAEPNLGDFTAPQSDHLQAASKLREIDYAGWAVIEMLANEAMESGHLWTAASYVARVYGPQRF